MNHLLDKVLKVYILIPIALILVLIDHVFNLKVFESLPDVPEKWLYFNFVFNLPHIVASNMQLFNNEVLDKYGRKLLIAFIMAIFVTYFFHWYLNFKAFVYLHSLWTLKHVILQQFNLCHGLGLKKNAMSLSWKVFGVILGVVVYWDIYKLFDWKQISFFPSLLTAAGLSFLMISIVIYMKFRFTQAAKMILANSGLIFFSYLLYLNGAELIAVLLIRVIHDCTGFIFYEALNEGKLKQGRASAYYTFSSKYIGSLLATVLPPIIFVIGVYTLPSQKVGLFIFMILSIMHYFSEGFLWKADGPYRKYL